jgi:hypothetical protein
MPQTRFSEKFSRRKSRFAFFILLLTLLFAAFFAGAATLTATNQAAFPPPLDSYGDGQMARVWDMLKNRVQKEPINLWATLLFLMAIIHTFLSHKFIHWSHVLEARHRERSAGKSAENPQASAPSSEPVSVAARVLHFFGEVEAVFGIWVIPLVILLGSRIGWQRTLDYLNNRVSFIEPVFVMIIMVISSTRPIIRLAELCMRSFAKLGGGGPGAWWLAILIVGPLLGSLITEPAAMTICSLLLGRQFYERKPPAALAYATLGLLFVNISVGGVLTHFAAPPVLMVTGPWGWNTSFMFRHFGLASVTGILAATLVYYLVFRRSFVALAKNSADAELVREHKAAAERPIPWWVTGGNLFFLACTVLVGHYPVLVVGGFLFFVAFVEVTTDYQSELSIRTPILVGFFLAGLVIHGGLQQWWIAPVLGRLKELPLMLGAIALTAFNDNAAVTYLATLVPGMTVGMKHAVVAGAVTGGGLTVIANAPNPAGQSLLGKFFPDGIAPLGLLLGALPATIILALCFIFIS